MPDLNETQESRSSQRTAEEDVETRSYIMPGEDPSIRIFDKVGVPRVGQPLRFGSPLRVSSLSTSRFGKDSSLLTIEYSSAIGENTSLGAVKLELDQSAESQKKFFDLDEEPIGANREGTMVFSPRVVARITRYEVFPPTFTIYRVTGKVNQYPFLFAGSGHWLSLGATSHPFGADKYQTVYTFEYDQGKYTDPDTDDVTYKPHHLFWFFRDRETGRVDKTQGLQVSRLYETEDFRILGLPY